MFEKILGKKEEEEVVAEVVAAEEVAPEVSEDAPEVAPEVVAETSGGVKFRASGHQKLYDRINPESRYAKNLVRRHGIK